MIKELKEKQLRLHSENTALLKRAKDDGRDVLNPDEEQEWQTRDAAYEAITKQIERYKRHEAVEAALSAPEARQTEPSIETRGGSARAMVSLSRGRQDMDLALRGWFLTGSAEGASEKHVEAAKRVGLNLSSKKLTFKLGTRAPKTLADIRALEARAQSVGTDADGGYTVPADEMMRNLEVSLLYFGGMRQVSTVIRTGTGADLPIPTANDTAQKGAILGENTEVADQDVAFGQVVLHAFKYSSKQVLVSVELMQDTAIDLPSFLGRALGERIGRIQNEHFTTGAGTTLPFGIVTRAGAGVTTAGSVTSGITYAHLVDLEHSVDIAYRQQGAAFMGNDVIVQRLKKLLDGNDRPIWMPNDAGIGVGAPATLLGYPFIVNNDMTTAATNGSKALLFGALGKYLIRDVLDVTLLRLDERYADFHQVAFLAFARADGDLLDAGTDPVKYFQYTT